MSNQEKYEDQYSKDYRDYNDNTEYQEFVEKVKNGEINEKDLSGIWLIIFNQLKNNG